jgi:hypothetical protein
VRRSSSARPNNCASRDKELCGSTSQMVEAVVINVYHVLKMLLVMMLVRIFFPLPKFVLTLLSFIVMYFSREALRSILVRKEHGVGSYENYLARWDWGFGQHTVHRTSSRSFTVNKLDDFIVRDLMNVSSFCNIGIK